MSLAVDLLAQADANLSTIRAEGATLVDLAGTHWEAVAPTCPGWTVGDVATHTASVHRWVARVVADGEPTRRREMPGPPAEPDSALAWCREALDLVTAILDAADPTARTWTFAASGERRTAWWRRRMAQETGMHRWDAAAAAGQEPPAGFAQATAASGIDEYLEDFLPDRVDAAWSGTLHLHATDGDGEWFLDLGDPAASLRREHVKAATAVRGPASDLLLWLWNRQPAAGHLETFGDAGVVDRWPGLAI